MSEELEKVKCYSQFLFEYSIKLMPSCWQTENSHPDSY